MIRRIGFSEKDRMQVASLSWDPQSQEDDFFDYSRVLIQKPWGHEYLLYRTSDVAVWILFIKQGCKTSLHCHPNKKTSLAILSGTAECATLNGVHPLKPGDGFLLEKGVFHSTAAVSSEGIILMETETPVNKRDLVRAFDTYGRVGKGYEGSSCYTELDGSVHCNFRVGSPAISQRIGEFELALGRYYTHDEFQKKFPVMPADFVAVLRGGVHGSDELVVWEAGDIMNTDEIKEQKEHLCLNQESEFLFIKHIA